MEQTNGGAHVNGDSKGEYKRLNIAIVGGSLGGLATGIALKHAGHKTTILERNPTSLLHNQGAGIVAGGDTLTYFQTFDRCQRPIACGSKKRLYIDKSGKIVHEVEMKQNMTSWDLAYYLMRANYDGTKSSYCEVPEAQPGDGEVEYRYGSLVTAIHDEGEKGVRVDYKYQPEGAEKATEENMTVDLVIGADGPSSTVRAMFHPEIKRTLAGYCALRGTLPENEAAEFAREVFVERFSFFHGPGTQLLAYLIPGTAGSIEPGERLINFVWYKNFPPESEEFKELMTDVDGVYHRLTIPPGKMNLDFWKKQVVWAKDNLPPQFYEVIHKIKNPFVQAVTDVITPSNSFMNGKVLLIGDALAGFRPHTVMSTSQAAYDAMLVDQYLREKIDWKTFRLRTMEYARFIQARGIRMGIRSQFGEDGKDIPLEGLIKDRDVASTPRAQEQPFYPEWTRAGIE